MIELSRLNHQVVVVNCDLIVLVEATPDTVLTLTTGEKVRVLEQPSAVIEKTIQYRRRIVAGAQPVEGAA